MCHVLPAALPIFLSFFSFFFFNDTATTEIYTLSLHDALPIWVSVKRVFGSLEQDVCQNTGLFLRADHGSQYDSKDFQKELKFLNLAYSPAFVRSPQCNGIIERFHRTLDEQVFDLNVFTNIEKTNIAIEQFVHDYNLYWQIHRLGLKSPIEYRESFESKSVGNLLYTK